jgi:hypothetical protein
VIEISCALLLLMCFGVFVWFLMKCVAGVSACFGRSGAGRRGGYFCMVFVCDPSLVSGYEGWSASG